MIWDGQRMPIQQATLRTDPADLSATDPGTVAVAQRAAGGPAFAPPAIAGSGTTVTGPAETVRVGQIYQVPVAGGTQYYVMLKTAWPRSPRRRTGCCSSSRAPTRNTLSPSQVTGHMSRSTPSPRRRTAGQHPRRRTPAAAAPLCMVYAGGGSALTARVETGGRVPSGGVATGMPADVEGYPSRRGRGAGGGRSTRPG